MERLRIHHSGTVSDPCCVCWIIFCECFSSRSPVEEQVLTVAPVCILIPKKGNVKECSNYRTITLISHASKVMVKILQARLQQYMNHVLPDIQAGFRKGRETREQIANIRWIIEKARVFQKNIYFWFIDYAKAFDCVDHNKLCKVLKRDGNTRPPYLPPEKSVWRSRGNS